MKTSGTQRWQETYADVWSPEGMLLPRHVFARMERMLAASQSISRELLLD